MDFHLKTNEKVRDDKVLVNLCGKLTIPRINYLWCSTSDKGLNEIAIHSNGLCVNIVIKDKYKDISEELKRQAIEV